MNPRIEKSVSATRTRWPLTLLTLVLTALCLASLLAADEQQASPDLTVHEWGTFTAVAGKDGKPVEWMPLTGSTDLPEFVEHLGGTNFKGGLRGTIRMETPVLYFYSPSAETVSVKAVLSRGLITEWYPHARTEPSQAPRIPDLHQLPGDGSISWNRVTVSPSLNGGFPRDVSPNRYYAARETSSTPLLVKGRAGDEQEKFLFYRGVSAAALPLSATLAANGELLVKSLDENEIPAMILFERRGKRVGYRLVNAPVSETSLQPPELAGSVESLASDLEVALVGQGLYPDEAQAMVETWRDSWFEEGSRLIYIVPRGFVDKILPLTIDPAPSQIVRVFVGRLEIVTPTTAKAVKTALSAHDEATLSKYGRFLEPILEIIREAPAQ